MIKKDRLIKKNEIMASLFTGKNIILIRVII